MTTDPVLEGTTPFERFDLLLEADPIKLRDEAVDLARRLAEAEAENERLNLRWADARAMVDKNKYALRNMAEKMVRCKTDAERARADKVEAEVTIDRERALWAEDIAGLKRAETLIGELTAAGEGLIEQIELEVGRCDGTEDSRLWPTANDMRAAIRKAQEYRERR